MNRSMRRGLFAALLVVAAVPAFAQFSESFNFLKAVRDRDGGKIAEIVSNPASTAINARDGTTGEGALHILVRGRDHGFLNYLLSRGARPDLQDNQGNSALNVAAQIGWVEGAELLIARGATVDLANRGGATPLIVAVQRRDAALVRLLVSRGADVNRTDSSAGLSALDYARRDTRAGPILRLLQAPRSPTPAPAPAPRPTEPAPRPARPVI